MADKVKKTTETKSIRETLKKGVSRRGFVKSAAVAATAVVAVAGVGKVASSLIPKENHQGKYDRNLKAGDIALQEREYVVMSDKEKNDLVRNLEKTYKFFKS